MTENHFLAINTSGGSCDVAVSKQNIILNSKKIVADKGYSEIIIPLIDTLLKESELNIKKLAGFLVCTGPGNYTSLRVAISITRSFSLACSKPACGISLFEILSTKNSKVLVLIKGPAEKIYVQTFSYGLKNNKPRLLSISEIQETKEFFGAETIGYRAQEIGKLINSNTFIESTEISFENFVTIGLPKLKKKCQRPTPLYIK